VSKGSFDDIACPLWNSPKARMGSKAASGMAAVTAARGQQASQDVGAQIGDLIWSSGMPYPTFLAGFPALEL